MKIFKDGKVYDSKEVQAILGISDRTLRRRIDSGLIVRISEKHGSIKLAGYRLNEYIKNMENLTNKKAVPALFKKKIKKG